MYSTMELPELTTMNINRKKDTIRFRFDVKKGTMKVSFDGRTIVHEFNERCFLDNYKPLVARFEKELGLQLSIHDSCNVENWVGILFRWYSASQGYDRLYRKSLHIA